jgi:diguanylate cyclase
MELDENDAVIVRSTIDLGRNLGLSVVAEGVESKEIWSELARLGCDFVQGYFLSRPLPAAAFLDWLGERSAVTAASEQTKSIEATAGTHVALLKAAGGSARIG